MISILTTPQASAELRHIMRRFQLFQFFNAVNFTIALGAPMVLAARAMGAKETMIGALVSFTPFLVLLQFLAINTTERLGPKKLVMAGWRARPFMILLAAPLPLLSRYFSPTFCLGAFALFLFLFNVIRGYTSIGWMPWLTRVIPEHLRGYYFGRDLFFVNTGVLLSLQLSGLFVRSFAGAWKYTVLFFFCWLIGVWSVHFLKDIPETTPTVVVPPPKSRRNAREMLSASHAVMCVKPFRQMTLFVALNSLGLAAFPGFLLLYQRDGLHLSDGLVLMVTSGGTVGALLTGQLWGRLTDRFGNRPILRLGGGGQLAVLLAWLLVATGLIPAPSTFWIVALSFVFGAAQAAVAVPQARLVIAFCPIHETTIGITLHGVVVSLCAGAAPLFWGMGLQFMRHQFGQHHVGAVFAIFFGVSAALTCAAQFYLRLIQESGSSPTSTVVLTLFKGWPMRVLSLGVFGDSTK